MKDAAHNAEYTKKINRQHILRLLREKPMPRIGLAAETGLTRAAITLITRELLAEGLITESAVSARTTGAPVPLCVNPDAACAAGVFWTRSSCMLGIADFSGKVLEQHEIPLRAPDGLALLKTELQKLLSSYADRRIAGIGVSAPGPVDAAGGVILNPPYFGDWHNTAVGPYLSSALGLPVYLEKDACVLALYHLGTGDSRDFLLLLLDSGIGSGVVSGGRLLVSCGHYTSELGHISVVFGGKPCGCGNRGCLEAYASIPNLLADSKTTFCSWEEVIDAGDTALIDREADYLSAGIVSLRNLINIDTVYLAGHIRYGFDLLAPRLMHRITRDSMTKAPIRVLPSYQLSDIGVAAAANLVFSKMLGQE